VEADMHTTYTDALIAAHAKDSVHTLTFHKGAARANLGAVAIADRLHKQVFEARVLEDLAENVENAPFQGRAFNFELIQQAVTGLFQLTISPFPHLRTLHHRPICFLSVTSTPARSRAS
jgi:hypothetical protein